MSETHKVPRWLALVPKIGKFFLRKPNISRRVNRSEDNLFVAHILPLAPAVWEYVVKTMARSPS